jgi:uncharacterized protein with PIN domain
MSTDTRFIRKAVADQLHKQQTAAVKGRMVARKEAARYRNKFGNCPDCGEMLFPVSNNEGLKIVGCKKCRYSKVVG